MRKQHIKINASRHLGMLGIGGIGLLLLVFCLCPMSFQPANAWTTNPDEATAESSLKTNTQLWAKPTIAISLSDTVNLGEITPKSSGVFTEGTAKLVVETNSRNGLAVLLNAVDSNAMTSDDKNIADSIKSISEKTTRDQFSGNTWGYYIGQAATDASTEYSPVPDASTKALETTTSGAVENYNIAFGAHIDTTLPAGMYSSSVLVSAVANPITVTLSQITTMQQMEPGICEATAEGSTKQLIDERDNQKYWVAKLADGNCWMVQNLALNLTEAGLRAANSDLASDWNQTSPYPPLNAFTSIAPITGIDKKQPYSWNLGKWVLATPLIPAGCNSVTEQGTCDSAGIVDVSSSRFQPTFDATAGVWTYPNGTKSSYTTIAVNCTEWNNNVCVAGTYDAHYLLGNYYAYNAAVATSGVDLEQTEAPYSICPHGWKLPGVPNTENGYGTLLSAYGISNTITGTVDGKTYNLVEKPLYFIAAGTLEPVHRALYSNGGSYWSSQALKVNGSSLMFTFDLSQSSVASRNNHHQYIGTTLRCVNR